MINDKSILAIIPARGGSKRLPRKNILDLNGKPLIQWSIDAALECKYIDKILVTTDDDEIINYVKKNNNIEIIKRPDELASDTAKSFDAIVHAIDQLTTTYEYIILLQPTSPLRTYQHINEAIELLDKKNAHAIVSVVEMDHSPLWSNTLPKNDSMVNFLETNVIDKRSQELEMYYRLNGAIYICKTDKLLKENSFFIEDNIFAYKMDRKSSIDIDEEIDFQFTEFLLNN